MRIVLAYLVGLVLGLSVGAGLTRARRSALPPADLPTRCRKCGGL